MKLTFSLLLVFFVLLSLFLPWYLNPYAQKEVAPVYWVSFDKARYNYTPSLIAQRLEEIYEACAQRNPQGVLLFSWPHMQAGSELTKLITQFDVYVPYLFQEYRRDTGGEEGKRLLLVFPPHLIKHGIPVHMRFKQQPGGYEFFSSIRYKEDQINFAAIALAGEGVPHASQMRVVKVPGRLVRIPDSEALAHIKNVPERSLWIIGAHDGIEDIVSIYTGLSLRQVRTKLSTRLSTLGILLVIFGIFWRLRSCLFIPLLRNGLLSVAIAYGAASVLAQWSVYPNLIVLDMCIISVSFLALCSARFLRRKPTITHIDFDRVFCRGKQKTSFSAFCNYRHHAGVVLAEGNFKSEWHRLWAQMILVDYLLCAGCVSHIDWDYIGRRMRIFKGVNLAFLLINRKTQSLTYLLFGSEPLFVKQGGEVTAIEASASFPLGVGKEVVPLQGIIEPQSWDEVFLVSSAVRTLSYKESDLLESERAAALLRDQGHAFKEYIFSCKDVPGSDIIFFTIAHGKEK